MTTSMNVKELRNVAKELQIKGYSAMLKDALIVAIAKAASEASGNNDDARHDPFYDDRSCNDHGADTEGFFTPDIVTTTTANNDVVTTTEIASAKLIEFVSADNVHVKYKAKGQLVEIYWSTEDYKLHISSKTKGDRRTRYAELIRMFKPFTNGIHGDIARVVKSIVRLKDQPASIKVARHKQLVASGLIKPVQSKENASASTTPRRGTVDMEWLQEYRANSYEENGVYPTGLEIRTAWLHYNELMNYTG